MNNESKDVPKQVRPGAARLLCLVTSLLGCVTPHQTALEDGPNTERLNMDTSLQNPSAAPSANPRLAPQRLATELIRIGEVGIARQDDAALEAFFAPGFVFHGPQGDLTLKELRGYFAALRQSLSGFTVERERILVDGNFVAARTRMTGIFQREFPYSPVGAVQPTGKRVSFVIHNIFRYDDVGRLAEEWAQLDNLGFTQQLGVQLTPSQLPRN